MRRASWSVWSLVRSERLVHKRAPNKRLKLTGPVSKGIGRLCAHRRPVQSGALLRPWGWARSLSAVR